jgi:hypothetical protein
MRLTPPVPSGRSEATARRVWRRLRGAQTSTGVALRRRPEAQLALRLRQKRRPPATPPTPAIIAERRFAHPWRSLGARLRRLIIVPSDRNETDNDLRRDPTPTSVQAGDSVFQARKRSLRAPRAPTVELIGRFPGCAYACASSEITGTLRASLPGQREAAVTESSYSRRCSRRDRGRRGRGFVRRRASCCVGCGATVGAVAKRPAAPACASLGRAFSASCRFASAASTVNRVPLAGP